MICVDLWLPLFQTLAPSLPRKSPVNNLQCDCGCFTVAHPKPPGWTPTIAVFYYFHLQLFTFTRDELQTEDVHHTDGVDQEYRRVFSGL